MPRKKNVNPLTLFGSSSETSSSQQSDHVQTFHTSEDSRRIRAIYTDVPVQHREGVRLKEDSGYINLEVDTWNDAEMTDPDIHMDQPKNPANINVRTQAKRYINSVRSMLQQDVTNN